MAREMKIVVNAGEVEISHKSEKDLYKMVPAMKLFFICLKMN